MLQLIPMTQADFADYLADAVPDYAQENVQAGYWPAEHALESARQAYDALLPAGLETPDHYLYTLRDDALEEKVGILWFAVRKQGGGRRAFVYHIVVKEAYRRRGYGTQAFRLLEERVKDMGIDTIMLQVFGHNAAARAMYERLGYQVGSLNMTRKLG